MTNAPIATSSGRRHEWSRGDRLRAARENMPGSPSQVEFSRLLGFSKNTVARYERDEPGANKPIVLQLWAERTGYDYWWLAGDPSEETPHTLPDIDQYHAAAGLLAA